MPVVSTAGVCSRSIEYTIDAKGIIRNVHFEGGCPGNLSGIERLVEGMSALEVIKRLEGITCGKKPTSCPDQLARALNQELSVRGQKSGEHDTV